MSETESVASAAAAIAGAVEESTGAIVVETSASEAADALARRAHLWRLTRTRKQAGQLVRNQIKIGVAIRDQRIRDMHDLDEARSEKQEWVGRTTEMLDQLFADPSVGERVNDWVGPILPEYAEFGNFVELFYGEMKHRLGRLNEVAAMIDKLPEPISTQAAGPSPAAPASHPAGARRSASARPAAAPAYVDASEPTESEFIDDDIPLLGAEAAAGAARSLADELSASIGSVLDEAVRPRAEARPIQQRSAAAAPSTPTPARAAVSASVGLLIVRGGAEAEAASKPVLQFLERLGLKLHTLPAPAADGAHVPAPVRLVAHLDAHREATFALLVCGPGPVPNDPDEPGEFQFQLGCCVGRLGAARSCVLHRGDHALAQQSDRRGVKQIALDDGEGWQLPLARHLKNGGVAVDLNRLL